MSIEDISKLPITYKQDLRDSYPFGLFTVPKSQLQRIHCSSGTTGKPTVVGYTKEDVELFSEVVARSLNAGARRGMQLHNAYGYGIFTGGLGLHYGAEKLGMSVLPISGGMTVRQVDLIIDFKPEVICCSPSYALTIADELANRGIPAEDISLKYAVLGSEPWTEIIRGHIEKTGSPCNKYLWTKRNYRSGCFYGRLGRKGRILYLGRSFLSGNTGSCNEAACSVW